MASSTGPRELLQWSGVLMVWTVQQMDASIMAVAVKWNLRALAVKRSVRQRVRTQILGRAMNLPETVPCSLVVIADLVTVSMAIVIGKDHPFTMGRAQMNFETW